MATRVFGLFYLGFLLTSCASLQEQSVGHIGCPADQITISNDHQDMTTRTWTASCRGKTFLCSSVMRPHGDSDVSCAEALAPAASSGAEAASN